jgi:NAD(P)-dependent dehydrogenase (short-subunit alcohol dehydrogenase family)
MKIADTAVLVTGANRGIGQALVEEALSRGAKRVYAGARQPLAHSDGRVTPLTLDVTDAAQIQAAADQVESLDSLRAVVAGRDVTVHAVLTGPVDTEMTRGLDIPKASPESVARAILDGVEREEEGEEEIFPDPMSQAMAESWRAGAAKTLERQNAALAQAAPFPS